MQREVTRRNYPENIPCLNLRQLNSLLQVKQVSHHTKPHFEQISARFSGNGEFDAPLQNTYSQDYVAPLDMPMSN